MAAFDLKFHAYCSIEETHLVIDSQIERHPETPVDRSCLKEGVLAAGRTVKTRWWGVAYQMLHSIVQRYAGGSIAHCLAFA